MATYGYIRVSTKKQNLERQIEILSKYKIDRIFQDKYSGKDISKLPALNDMIDIVKPNDTVIIVNINRIGRDVLGVLTILKRFEDKKVKLIISDSPFKKIDFKNPQTMLTLYIQVIMSDYERKLMLMTQRAGIEVAKKRGKYIRVPKMKKKKQDEIMELLGKGLKQKEVAKILDVSTRHIINVIKHVKAM